MIKAQFKYTILYVNDVKKTISFYKKAFGLSSAFITPEGDYGELDTGNTTLSYANHKLGNSNLKLGYLESNKTNLPFGIELAFVTDDIEVTLKQAIEVGASLLEPTVTKPWGQQVGYLLDPDGFLLDICTPVTH
jgi:lactoylglutathione lyase